MNRVRDILISYEILIRGGLGLIGWVRVRDILITYGNFFYSFFFLLRKSYGNTDKILYEISDFAGGGAIIFLPVGWGGGAITGKYQT